MTAETNLLNLLSTRAAAFKTGDWNAAYGAIQDLGDKSHFRGSSAASRRAASEYERSFGDVLEALHPFVQAYGLLLAIGADRAVGSDVAGQTDELRTLATVEPGEEIPTLATLNAILTPALARLAALPSQP